MPLETLQIIDSPPESYLSPSAIWKYWKEEVIIDHRSYYSAIEFLAVLAIQHILTHTRYITLRGDEGLHWFLWIGEGLTLLLGIIALHWYGNQRRSSHFLTRLGSHLTVLVSLTVSFIACQILATISVRNDLQCFRLRLCRVPGRIEWTILMIYWLCLLLLIMAITVISFGPRRKRQRHLDAHMGDSQPEAEGAEQGLRGKWYWLLMNVADGIDDDYPQEVGELRIEDDEAEPADQSRQEYERGEAEGALRI